VFPFAREWAWCVKELLDVHYSEALKIHLVLGLPATSRSSTGSIPFARRFIMWGRRSGITAAKLPKEAKAGEGFSSKV
jgi:hypothetical protein